MGKIDYITEMQDAFGIEEDSKELLKIAKKIKSIQGKALPTDEFKKNLSMKLEAVYELDKSEDVAPSFSIFQIFGAVCSLIFISGALLSVYTMRSDTQKVTHISTPHIIKQENSVSPSVDDSVVETTVVEEVNHSNQETIIESKENEGTLSVEVNSFPVVLEEENIQSEVNIIESVSDFQNVQEKIEDSSEAPVIHNSSFFDEDAPSRADVRIFDLEDSQEVSTSIFLEFLQICMENDGTISEDEYECIFPDGGICNQDNIFSYSLEPCEALYKTQRGLKEEDNGIELDVGELIENYGQ